MTVSLDDVYRSANGDTWRLLRHPVSGQLFVRHEANQPSGGHVTELGVETFLSQGGPGPEYAAIRDFLAKAAKDQAAPAAVATTRPLSFAMLDPPITDPVARATSISSGSEPQGGFAALVPELDVTDLQASLRFWCGLIGFTVAFERPLARFAYLVRGPLQLMLCERNGNWEVAELNRPFGRGINFQMNVERLTPILAALEAADWPLYRSPNDAWYRTGDRECGQREFLVQDPDGYLLRFAEDLGKRSPGKTG